MRIGDTTAVAEALAEAVAEADADADADADVDAAQAPVINRLDCRATP